MMYPVKVHDLLPPLIKNLEAEPVLHLFKLLKNLPLKEHTEHTIYLAQVPYLSPTSAQQAGFEALHHNIGSC
jgi:hypothetical protein